MKKIIISALVVISVQLHSCSNNGLDNTLIIDSLDAAQKTKATVVPYTIAETLPYETNTKAQVQAYVYLKSDTVTKQNLEATLVHIYSNLKSYNNFNKFSEPTTIGVYLYASENNANNMRESWLAMLSKTPVDQEPRITFDDRKIAALSGQKDGFKSDDEKKYDELISYFKNRNTDLCTIYKILYNLEIESIKQADIKYPNFGIEHAAYSTKWYKKEEAKVYKKYNIHDSLAVSISVFGMNYCK